MSRDLPRRAPIQAIPCLIGLVPAAINAPPGIINAVRGKDAAPYLASAPASFSAEDEKILRTVAPVVAATMPAVAEAMRGGRYRIAA
jgi:hypothetical protein